MVPKEEMIVLDMTSSIEDALRVVQKTGHSRFPIKDRAKSDIIGFIHAKDLIGLTGDWKKGSIKGIIRSAYFISGMRKIDAQLRGFQQKKLHQTIMLDQEGTVTGLITLEDILEELVGSIQDEHD
jgi:magnesium and cobalt transporter